jgi:periplasmic divalent cation tolerance protein
VTDTALLVLTTCGSAAEAAQLARSLVEDRLAACVNVVPRVLSTYRWQGQVEQAEECLLLIKTTASRYAALERAIRERSSYELPEVLAVRPETGSSDYLAWVGASVHGVEE